MNGPYLALVLVTGSRTFDDVPAIHAALAEAWHEAMQDGYSGIEVMQGGAEGPDSIAGAWAKGRVADGVGHQQVDADWAGPCAPECKPGHRQQRYGRDWCPTAGHRRNQQMVDAGPLLTLAFIAPCGNARCRKPKPHDSHGVTHCIEAAERAGVPVRKVRAA